jgi:hypothetical protein
MAALIPALISMFMSRARGGGGGGGGRPPKPEKSLADKDNEYWEKQGLSTSSGMDAYEAALKSMPKMMSFEDAMKQFDARD